MEVNSGEIKDLEQKIKEQRNPAKVEPDKNMLNLEKAYRIVFSSTEGRMVLKHIMELCKVKESVYTLGADNHTNHEATYYILGQKEVFQLMEELIPAKVLFDVKYNKEK